ncbi:serine/threonine-protein phosphatase [Kitasatospora xanthocidica]|uniref:Serine/threonine-protein phosphatase n=1 Tax=Kitasatospora xanthocidica TaxID=83382 RepID=A0A372ZSE1_9ACTN|nr:MULTISPECIES: PP2C family protein-serine/threonine phosphatase [Streptomycetaceae]OKI07841.1 serine/threonine protein phosphatase [Streptomyces sp. CB02056]RGD58382.1 serine/threonine-protein phosphatase [Kitasatospora xanthocidica]
MTADGPDGVPPLHLPRRTRLLLYGSLLLLVAAVVAALAIGPGTTLAPLLAVAPVLAGATTRRARVPLLVGAAAVVAVGLLESANAQLPLSVRISVPVTVLASTLASAASVVLVAARERELFQVRTVAEAAQRALLRPPPERIGPLRLAVRYVAAAAEARIGGDLYAVVETRFGLRILLGDVQGHGLPAVETAADVLGVFREAARTEPDPGRLAERLDAALAARPSEEGRFATALLLDVAPDRGPVRLVNCGHPPPLLRRAGRVSELEPPFPAPPLGLLGLTDDSYPDRRFDPEPGDLLLLHTDGVSEARDAAGRFYPIAERLPGLHGGTPADLLDAVLTDVGGWVGDAGLADDAAVLAIRWEP